jgi:hypothetical protein
VVTYVLVLPVPYLLGLAALATGVTLAWTGEPFALPGNRRLHGLAARLIWMLCALAGAAVSFSVRYFLAYFKGWW